MDQRGKYYNEHAKVTNLEKITSSDNNANILRMLRGDDEPGWDGVLSIGRNRSINYPHGNYYAMRGGSNLDWWRQVADDLGWLGYFIGRSYTLHQLCITDFPGEPEGIDAFIEGINRNRSIQVLDIESDFGGVVYDKMTPFFRNNSSLSHLTLRGVNITIESASSIAMILRQINDLHHLALEESNLGEEELTEILTALSTRPLLEELHLRDNNIDRVGCATLGALLGSKTLNVKSLSLPNNEIDDEGLQMLVAGMTNNTIIEQLSLCGNESISTRGLRSLTPLLQSERCSLTDLYFYRMNIGDEGFAVLARGLSKNTLLQRLWFDLSTCGITSAGWQSFATLLCDTSSVNNTYLSNHTLELIGKSCDVGSPTDQVHDHVRDLLRMRKIANSKEVAMRKIFQSHPDLDMEPFFEWGLKFLPWRLAGLRELNQTGCYVAEC